MIEGGPSERELVRLCLNREEDAWRMLVTRYQRRVYNLCYQFFGKVGRAEDMTQEVFVKLYGALHRYNFDMEFSTWLMSVARNLCIDFYRRHKKERMVDIEEIPMAVAPESTGPAAALERQEAHRQVHRGLMRLSEELRMAVILRDIQGYGYDEIGAIMGVPLGTVKSRINRGRLELARALMALEQGGTA